MILGVAGPIRGIFQAIFQERGVGVFGFCDRRYETARTYTRGDLWRDWGPDWSNWDNGVREGRVLLVTGSEARGESGTSLAVQFPAGETGPKESGAQWQLFFVYRPDTVG